MYLFTGKINTHSMSKSQVLRWLHLNWTEFGFCFIFWTETL